MSGVNIENLIQSSKQQHKLVSKQNSKIAKSNRPKHYVNRLHDWEVSLAREIRDKYVDGNGIFTCTKLLETYKSVTNSSTQAAHTWLKKFKKKFALSARAPCWNSNPCSDDTLYARIKSNFFKYDALKRELSSRAKVTGCPIICVNYDETNLPNRINKETLIVPRGSVSVPGLELSAKTDIKGVSLGCFMTDVVGLVIPPCVVMSQYSPESAKQAAEHAIRRAFRDDGCPLLRLSGNDRGKSAIGDTLWSEVCQHIIDHKRRYDEKTKTRSSWIWFHDSDRRHHDRSPSLLTEANIFLLKLEERTTPYSQPTELLFGIVKNWCGEQANEDRYAASLVQSLKFWNMLRTLLTSDLGRKLFDHYGYHATEVDRDCSTYEYRHKPTKDLFARIQLKLTKELTRQLFPTTAPAPESTVSSKEVQRALMESLEDAEARELVVHEKKVEPVVQKREPSKRSTAQKAYQSLSQMRPSDIDTTFEPHSQILYLRAQGVPPKGDCANPNGDSKGITTTANADSFDSGRKDNSSQQKSDDSVDEGSESSDDPDSENQERERISEQATLEDFLRRSKFSFK